MVLAGVITRAATLPRLLLPLVLALMWSPRARGANRQRPLVLGSAGRLVGQQGEQVSPMRAMKTRLMVKEDRQRLEWCRRRAMQSKGSKGSPQGYCLCCCKG